MINVGDERRMAAESVARFGVKTPSLRRRSSSSRAATSRRSCSARWFALSPDVIVLSEPTRGIDVGAKSEVYGLIQDMAEERRRRS